MVLTKLEIYIYIYIYIYILYLYSMINSYKKIENGMMEWRDEYGEMEDDRKMVKNGEIW